MDEKYAAAYPELYKNHWWWRVREEILLRKIRRMLADRGRPRILDVGCGAGLFFDALEPLGHVEGIESDRGAVQRSGRWRTRITTGQLDGSYTPNAPFDLILLLDVLEHVSEAEQLLRRAGEILAPRGRVLITVPAFNWLWTTHDDMNHHVRRYTAGEMRQTIERADLVPIETRFMFQSLVVPKLLVRLRESLISVQPRVPTLPPAAVNGAVQTWFRTEYRVAGWLPFGGSLIAVASHERD